MFLAVPGVFAQQVATGHKKLRPCYCGNVQGREHYRYYVAHRPYESSIRASSPRSVEQFLAFSPVSLAQPDYPAAGVETTLVRIEGGTLESATVDLEECDMVLEIRGKKGMLTARIPNNKDYCDLRDKILAHLRDSCGVDTLWEKKGAKFERNRQPEITVVGCPFYDARIAAKGVKRGWEIRPAQDIIIHRSRR